MPPKNAPHNAKHTKIVCRLCGPSGKALNRQSYADHLRNAHHDTSGNLREWGQASLFQFTAPAAEAGAVAVEVGAEAGGGAGDGVQELPRSRSVSRSSDEEGAMRSDEGWARGSDGGGARGSDEGGDMWRRHRSLGQQVVAGTEVGAAAGRPARRKTLAGGLGGREAR